MRKFDKEKFVSVCRKIYIVYYVCYCIASIVTLIVLYKDEIMTFIKKVMVGYKRILLKLVCFFKRLQDKLRPKRADYSWINDLAEVIDRCPNQRSAAELFGEDYAYSEE